MALVLVLALDPLPTLFTNFYFSEPFFFVLNHKVILRIRNDNDSTKCVFNHPSCSQESDISNIYPQSPMVWKLMVVPYHY